MDKLTKIAVQKAREAFDNPNFDISRGSTGEGDMLDALRRLQNDLAAWQNRNFGAQEPFMMALGLAEETGELSHAVLKHLQRIRGLEDPWAFRAAAGDAAGDIFIYLVNFLTILRLDAGTLFVETAKRVMNRDFQKDPQHGGEK